MKTAVWMVLTSVAVTAAPLAAAPEAGPVVTLRTYNYAQVSDAEAADARHETASILREAGIGIEWMTCRVRPASIARHTPNDLDAGLPCTEPFAKGREFMLRLMHGSHSQLGPVLRVSSLGTSILDRSQRTGVLMTLDLGPIRTIAERASIAMSELLGRAIAHEVGHLLLGSGVHSREGLMRAFWSQDELREAKPAHWRFSASEAARMRSGLTARGRAAN
jgi:hypothetical protein